MKTPALLSLIAITGLLSCSRTANPPAPVNPTPNNPVTTTPTTPTVTPTMITGWWKANPNDPLNGLEWSRLYFGPDSVQAQGGWGKYFVNSWWMRHDSIDIYQGGDFISKVSISYSTDTVITFRAGSAYASYIRMDSGLVTSAPLTTVVDSLYYPLGLAIDAQGNLYISDNSFRIKKVAVSGKITVLAGTTGFEFYAGDGGPATAASIDATNSIAVDEKGNIYLTDDKYHVVREIFASDGTIHTIAGKPGPYGGYSGDGGPADSAQFQSLASLALDANDNLYVADHYNGTIRRIDATTHIITTIAGTGTRGFSGDGGPAASAQLTSGSITTDKSGNIYVSGAGRIRKIDAGSGIIHTIAGTGVDGYNGEGLPATQAQLNGVGSMLIDPNGNLFFGDYGRLREISAADGKVYTVAGEGIPGFSPDCRHATLSQISGSAGIVEDNTGAIYFNDPGNNITRKIAAH